MVPLNHIVVIIRDNRNFVLFRTVYMRDLQLFPSPRHNLLFICVESEVVTLSMPGER